MSTTYQARPTLYKGVRMRSRLEALYAAWLDNYRDAEWPDEPFWKWSYEPMAFGSPDGQYLPDFFVYSAAPNPDLTVQRTAWQEVEAGMVSCGFFAEVKPGGPEWEAEMARSHSIGRDHPAAIGFHSALDRMHVIRDTYPESTLCVVANVGSYDAPNFFRVACCFHHIGCSPKCATKLSPEWREDAVANWATWTAR